MARNPQSDSSIASSAKRQKVVIANEYVSELLPINPALLDLPPEMQLEIFQYLDHRQVFTKLPLVCKQLNNVIKGYSIPLDEITIYVGWSKIKLIKLSERLLGCRKVTLSTRENCFSVDRLELMKPELMKLLKALAGNVMHLKVQTGSFLERGAVQQQIFQQWVNEAIFQNDEESKKLKILQHFKNDWDWKWQPECQSIVEVRLHFGTYFNLPEMFRRLPSLEKLVLREYERIREWSTVTSNDLQNVRTLTCHNFLPPLQQNVVFNNVYKLIFISIGPAYFRENVVDQLHSSFPHLTDLDITFQSHHPSRYCFDVNRWFYGLSLLMYALHSQLHHLQLLKLTRQYPVGREFGDEDYDDDLILHLRNLPARISRIEFAVQATMDGKIVRRVLWNRY
jgi:hypothetical protein